MKLDLQVPSSSPIFVADMEPPEHILEESRGLAREADIRLLFTKHNQIAVWQPIVRPIENTVSASVFETLDIPWSMPTEFFMVHTVVACRPDSDCVITWLRVEFDLVAETQDPRYSPIACKLFPSTEADERLELSSVELTEDLAINVLGIVDSGLAATKDTVVVREVFRTWVTTYGYKSSRSGWDFRVTEAHPQIAGNITILMVLAKPQGIPSTGFTRLFAETQVQGSTRSFPLVAKSSTQKQTPATFEIGKARDK